MGVSCAVRAFGLINALGADPASIWPRALAGDRSRLSRRDDLVPGHPLCVAAVQEPLPALPPEVARFACRNNALALAVLRQMEPAVRAAIAAVGPDRVGVVVGTSTSGVGDAERAMRDYVAGGALPGSFDYVQLEHGGLAAFIAAYLGTSGPAYTLSTACSSGAKALASARSLLALEVCDAVVTGGADSLCGMTTNGFWGLQLVSSEASNPFSANRRGLTIGEGAALFLLTRGEGPVALTGAGECTEGYEMSAPDPDGAGAETAMRAALRDAGVEPGEVTYLALHGTGTRLNDAMESKAAFRLFGDRTWCSASKALVGHTLGASGPVELGLACLMLAHPENGTLPLIPHCWDHVADPALPALRLADRGDRATVAGRPIVLLNSFGFGGNNCSLVIEGTPC